MERTVNWIHRGVWIITGLVCFYIALDGIRLKRDASDILVLVVIGSLFLGLAFWVIMRERRQRDQNNAIKMMGELKDLP